VIVFVGLIFQLANIRVEIPININIRFIINEIRKRKAHGFKRNICWDKIKQLRIFSIIPKIKINIVKEEFNCLEMLSSAKIKSTSNEYDIILFEWIKQQMKKIEYFLFY